MYVFQRELVGGYEGTVGDRGWGHGGGYSTDGTSLAK